MIDWLETGKLVAPLLTGGGVWAFLAARAKAKPAIAATQADMAEALTAQTKLLLQESAKDRQQLKRRIDHQGRVLSRVTLEIAECNGRHAECETTVATLREQVDKLMADNPPASYS